MNEELEERFHRAAYLMKFGPKIEIDNRVKLLFYSYYKQVRKGFHGKSCIHAVGRRRGPLLGRSLKRIRC